MKSSDVKAAFDTVRARPPIKVGVNAVQLDEFEHVYFAIDIDDNPLCLIGGNTSHVMPPIRLKNLHVDFNLRMSAEISGKTVTENFIVIKLVSSSNELFSMFSLVLGSLLENLSRTPSTGEIDNLVRQLVNLFKPKAETARDRIKGLFGELSVILAGSDVNRMVDAWHSQINSSRDFSFPGAFLEVKCTEAQRRVHKIGASQISPAEKPVYLASLHIVEDPQGKSIVDLINTALEDLSGLSRDKFLEQVTATLGPDADDFETVKFKSIDPVHPIWLFDCKFLPQVVPQTEDPILKSSISEIAFKLNLETVQSTGVPSMKFGDFEDLAFS